ncbi:hypothetical protein VTP01DRAFT_7350 [Rhizomucor pusillus]|uniref:uncharacterized protein n=1 Tax=Rhizomucor pusillus TaxID=4840 RepID=UPI00374455B1
MQRAMVSARIYGLSARPVTLTSRLLSRHQQTSRSMSAYSHMSDNDPEVLEKEKHRQQQTRNKQWNEKLASTSEANVKADQDADRPLEELQKETKEALERKRKEEPDSA